MKKSILLFFVIASSGFLYSKTTKENGLAKAQSSLPPFVADICIVTVDEVTKSNIVVWEHSTYPAYIKSTNVYRKTAIGSDTLLANIPVTAESEYVDSDPGIDVDQSSYTYRIAAVDSNGNENAKSLPHRTIHLAVSYSAATGAVTMDWNEYSGLAVINANGYDCYRGTKSTAAASIWPFSYSGTGSQVSHPDQIPSQALTDQPFYYVTLHTNKACNTAKSYNDSKSNTAVLSLNSVNNTSLVEQMYLSPNPSKDITMVHLTKLLSEPIEISIFDISGKLVFSKKSNTVAGENQFLINTSILAPGIYQMRATSVSQSYVRKLIVE